MERPAVKLFTTEKEYGAKQQAEDDNRA